MIYYGDKLTMYNTKEDLLTVDFGNGKRYTIKLVIDPNTRKYGVHYTPKTHAFKLINYLLKAKGYKKLNPEKWFKFMNKHPEHLYDLEYFKNLVYYLWYSRDEKKK